jgi:hypothetical protein
MYNIECMDKDILIQKHVDIIFRNNHTKSYLVANK